MHNNHTFYHLLVADSSQQVLIGLFPTEKCSSKSWLDMNGSDLSLNYHDVLNVRLVGLIPTAESM